MIPINTVEVGRIERNILGMRFYGAIRASTEDPKKKRYYLDLMKKEELKSDESEV